MEVETVPAAEDEARLTQLRFDAAVKVIKSLPPDGPFQPSNDMMLKFYSYYKQATVGACNIPRPGFWDAVGKAKWDAWNSLGDMSKEAAMAAYVDEMKLILEGMPMTDEVEELLRVLGPFYELVDEKKKITQISDLSSGLGSVMNSMQSKSFAKSIVRTMEMNGTLETRPPRLKPQEVKEHSDVDEEEEEEEEQDEAEEDEEEAEEEEEEVKKDKKAEARKKASSRSHKAPLSNGKVANGGAHLTNGARQQEAHAAGHALLNGHHSEQSVGPAHIASDSDSEVYCDSVDQFGQDETSERLGSQDDLEEEEEEEEGGGGGEQQAAAPASGSEDLQDPPHVIRCGGEDGDVGGSAMSQRRRQNVERQDASLRRGSRGSRSPGGGGGGGSGPLAPLRGGGDGDGDGGAWGGGGGGSLNEQIVVALARLQDDMQSVLQRLHTLEALTATQARSAALSPVYASAPVTKKKNRNPSWWPFDLSPSSLVLAVVWPFVVQWLIRLFLQRRRRRIN